MWDLQQPCWRPREWSGRGRTSGLRHTRWDMEGSPCWFLAQIFPTSGDTSTFCTSPEIRKLLICFQTTVPHWFLIIHFIHSIELTVNESIEKACVAKHISIQFPCLNFGSLDKHKMWKHSNFCRVWPPGFKRKSSRLSIDNNLILCL